MTSRYVFSSSNSVYRRHSEVGGSLKPGIFSSVTLKMQIIIDTVVQRNINADMPHFFKAGEVIKR